MAASPPMNGREMVFGRSTSRGTLRKLSGKKPSSDELASTLESLVSQSDHTVAIIGSSLVEEALKQLLISSFKSKATDLPDRVFLNRGPLSDFNSKIVIAEAFGVIKPHHALELNIIRRIRNAFAHTPAMITFDDAEVGDAVREFTMIEKLAGEDEITRRVMMIPFHEVQSKRGFLLICEVLMVIISVYNKRLGGEYILSLLGDLPSNSPIPRKGK